MQLSQQQENLLATALDESFDRQKLTIFLARSEGIEKDIENITQPATLDFQIHQIIQEAKMDGWVDALVMQAVISRPSQSKFAELASQLGLSPAGNNLSTYLPIANEERDNNSDTFESIIRGGRTDFDVAQFLSKLSTLQSQICRIATTNPDGNGTGFLVAPDLVLTNYHVMKPVIENHVSSSDVRFLFDYRRTADNSRVLPGKPYSLLETNWNIDQSEYSEADKAPFNGSPGDHELDYCLVRLNEAAGRDKAGASLDFGADERGFVKIQSDQNSGNRNSDVIILQHPEGDPLKMALGRHLGFNDVQNRMKYDADTQKGSSGSPVLNRDLEVIGLHHRGDPNADELAMTAEFNQGIPIMKIIRHMTDKGITQFWG